MSKQRKDGVISVSATELAQMGVCERQVVFDHRLGLRLTAERRAAMRRGVEAHAEFKFERPSQQSSCRWLISWLGRAIWWLRSSKGQA